jgi:hypothetical protein
MHRAEKVLRVKVIGGGTRDTQRRGYPGGNSLNIEGFLQVYDVSPLDGFPYDLAVRRRERISVRTDETVEKRHPVILQDIIGLWRRGVMVRSRKDTDIFPGFLEVGYCPSG